MENDKKNGFRLGLHLRENSGYFPKIMLERFETKEK